MEIPGEVDKMARFLSDRTQMEEYKRVVIQNKYAWWMKTTLSDKTNNVNYEVLFAVVEKEQMKSNESAAPESARPFGGRADNSDELYVAIDFDSALLLYGAVLGRVEIDSFKGDNWCSQFQAPDPNEVCLCKALRKHIRQVHFDSKKVNMRWCIDMNGFDFLMRTFNIAGEFEAAFSFQIGQFVPRLFNGFGSSQCMMWSQPPSTYLKKAITLKKIEERIRKAQYFLIVVYEMFKQWPPQNEIIIMPVRPPNAEIECGRTFVLGDFKYVDKNGASNTQRAAPPMPEKRKLPPSIAECTQPPTKRIRSPRTPPTPAKSPARDVTIVATNVQSASPHIELVPQPLPTPLSQEKPTEDTSKQPSSHAKNGEPTHLSGIDSDATLSSSESDTSRHSENSAYATTPPVPESAVKCLRTICRDKLYERVRETESGMLPKQDIHYLENIGAKAIVPSLIVEYFYRTGAMPKEVAAYYHQRFSCKDRFAPQDKDD